MVMRADVQLSHEQYTDPFGKMQAMYINTSLGVDNVGPLAIENGLPGQRLQPSGFMDNGWRTYDPTLPGYTQPDRLDVLGRANDPELMVARMLGATYWEAGPNHLYGYANQNPVVNLDRYGLGPMSALACEVVVGAKTTADFYETANRYKDQINRLNDLIEDIDNRLQSCPDSQRDKLEQMRREAANELSKLASEIASSRGADVAVDGFSALACAALYLTPTP